MTRLNAGFFVAGILFSLGLLGAVVRRNFVFILMSLEIMLNATGLAFVSAGSAWHQPDGQVFFFFVLSAAAAEVAVGLALVLRLNQEIHTLDANFAMELGEPHA